MTKTVETFPFVVRDPTSPVTSLAPVLPMVLSGARKLSVLGLLDTGSTLNVLPYQAGVALGLDWNQQTTRVQLAGNLAATEARVAILMGSVGQFAPVRLAFAWTERDDIPLILGQVNFFLEFDVCFFRNRSVFEVRPRSS
jgi:hypothetical protein